MTTNVIAVLALGALCGGWIIFQRWMSRRMPEAPGIHRRCDGCTGEGFCELSGKPCRDGGEG